jgi:hypothetical protein
MCVEHLLAYCYKGKKYLEEEKINIFGRTEGGGGGAIWFSTAYYLPTIYNIYNM